MEIIIKKDIKDALADGQPVVALESTVIAHGLPAPKNIETAFEMERAVTSNGALPATIAVFNGKAHIGLTADQIERLATEKDIRKISTRDIAIAAARRLNCATTVATTCHFAHRAGIRVFATGGIGGVHRGFNADTSADLPMLAATPITVVCSGAKIVLDLAATREWLETFGVPVLGWQCDEMPAFYSASSGLEIDERIDTADDAAAIIEARDDEKLDTAVLVCVPVPQEFEIAKDEMEKLVESLVETAARKGIYGKKLTPYLLSAMSDATAGRTLAANIALLVNNAGIAASIASKLS